MSQTETEVATTEAPVDGPPVAPPAKTGRPPRYGELIPPFTVASDRNPKFHSLALGGHWIVLMFFGSLAIPAAKAAHDRILARRAVFDDTRVQFFGVGIDPTDRTERGLKNSLPGLRYFWDFDLAVCRKYGLATEAGFTPRIYLLDQRLRVAAAQTLEGVDFLLDHLEGCLRAEGATPPSTDAPVLTAPRILEPDFCKALIDHYNQIGGRESGFMREVNGRTYPVLDDGTKRRRDVTIEDPELGNHLRWALTYRLIPLIKQAFIWEATRIERFIVACYSAEDQGFFRTHRDNTTSATAHRRLAVTINLNDDYDGGDLRFPEFGTRTYRPPMGGATVFSCSLLHEATPVTRGVRYATLPFLYDEAGLASREAGKEKLVTTTHTLDQLPPAMPGGTARPESQGAA